MQWPQQQVDEELSVLFVEMIVKMMINDKANLASWCLHPSGILKQVNWMTRPQSSFPCLDLCFLPLIRRRARKPCCVTVLRTRAISMRTPPHQVPHNAASMQLNFMSLFHLIFELNNILHPASLTAASSEEQWGILYYLVPQLPHLLAPSVLTFNEDDKQCVILTRNLNRCAHGSSEPLHLKFDRYIFIAFSETKHHVIKERRASLRLT